jgi:hypothetical protein
MRKADADRENILLNYIKLLQQGTYLFLAIEKFFGEKIERFTLNQSSEHD